MAVPSGTRNRKFGCCEISDFCSSNHHKILSAHWNLQSLEKNIITVLLTQTECTHHTLSFASLPLFPLLPPSFPPFLPHTCCCDIRMTDFLVIDTIFLHQVLIVNLQWVTEKTLVPQQYYSTIFFENSLKFLSVLFCNIGKKKSQQM